jgi:hypothetical protein
MLAPITTFQAVCQTWQEEVRNLHTSGMEVHVFFRLPEMRTIFLWVTYHPKSQRLRYLIPPKSFCTFESLISTVAGPAGGFIFGVPRSAFGRHKRMHAYTTKMVVCSGTRPNHISSNLGRVQHQSGSLSFCSP